MDEKIRCNYMKCYFGVGIAGQRICSNGGDYTKENCDKFIDEEEENERHRKEVKKPIFESEQEARSFMLSITPCHDGEKQIDCGVVSENCTECRIKQIKEQGYIQKMRGSKIRVNKIKEYPAKDIEKVQIPEEVARAILHETSFVFHTFKTQEDLVESQIEKLKEKGYIKKSALEEARENVERFGIAPACYNVKCSLSYSRKLISELEKEVERLNKIIDKDAV